MARCCKPLADADTHAQAFDKGLRVVAMDGSNFELPDEPDNVEQFGYPGSRTGHAGYPQAQCAVLVAGPLCMADGGVEPLIDSASSSGRARFSCTLWTERMPLRTWRTKADWVGSGKPRSVRHLDSAASRWRRVLMARVAAWSAR